MACTIAVARRGQQRSLARIFQVLSMAMARWPRARILACVRLTAFRRLHDHRGCKGQVAKRGPARPNGMRSGRSPASSATTSRAGGAGPSAPQRPELESSAGAPGPTGQLLNR